MYLSWPSAGREIFLLLSPGVTRLRNAGLVDTNVSLCNPTEVLPVAILNTGISNGAELN